MFFYVALLAFLFSNNLIVAQTNTLTPIIVNLNYNETKTYSINNSIEYILQYSAPDLNYAIPPRLWIESSDANVLAPLLVVARQPTEIMSWQLPYIVECTFGDKVLSKTARTLCHDVVKHKKIGSKSSNLKSPTVSVSTVSDVNISFNITVGFQKEFIVDHLKEYNFTITPSEPMYYYYNFSSNSTTNGLDSNYETVILEVTSEDEICMTVSIQNVSCPVFDTNQDVTFRGFYETVDKKGGITIPKYKFPYGFYIVFVAKPDDFDCDRVEEPEISSKPGQRIKHISMIIKPSVSFKDYVNAVMATLGSIGAFYLLFGCSYFFYSYKTSVPKDISYVDLAEPSGPSSRVVVTPSINSTAMQNIGTTDAIEDNTSIDEIEYDIVLTDTDRELRLCRSQPYLNDLAKKHPKVLQKKSYLYLYNVLTVALFYGLPVVQLVVAYQRTLNETGQQDLCYYNFLCAHPLGLLSDFNHVFSNVGYVLLGILFLIITYNRELSHKNVEFDSNYGIPQHYGLFYALGVALIMEGVLSGSYHVCPNQTNFQFDSSFMYVMAVLCMIKLYQNRHPDINATAYTTFGVLALAILLGMIGIFEGTKAFWIFFVILHVGTCFYLSIKVYYMGCWRLTRESMRRISHLVIYDFWSGPLNVLKPCYKARFVLLVLGNILNWAMAFFALYKQPSNFAVFLLAIFMANTLFYFLFYIVMKYVHGERVRLMTWIFLICSTFCAISAMYFFLHKSVLWSETAAKSRRFNVECKLMNFYDYHDIWHYLSAVGMFFTFMALLTLDDDLSHISHSRIPVF